MPILILRPFECAALAPIFRSTTHAINTSSPLSQIVLHVIHSRHCFGDSYLRHLCVVTGNIILRSPRSSILNGFTRRNHREPWNQKESSFFFVYLLVDRSPFNRQIPHLRCSLNGVIRNSQRALKSLWLGRISWLARNAHWVMVSRLPHWSRCFHSS